MNDATPPSSSSRRVSTGTASSMDESSSLSANAILESQFRMTCSQQPVTTVAGLLAVDKEMYWFSVVTGLILPGLEDANGNGFSGNGVITENRELAKAQIDRNSSSGSTSKWQVDGLSLWVYLLHLCIIINTIVLFGVGIYLFVTVPSTVYNEIYIWTAFVGPILQNIFLYPAVIVVRRSFFMKRQIDIRIYHEAFQYAYRIGKILLFLLTSCLIVFTALDTAVTHMSLVAAMLVTFLPSVTMLVGVSTFAIMEQRISYHMIADLQHQIKSHSITFPDYLLARKSLATRDSESPINLIVAAALLNTLVCFLLLILIAGHHLTRIQIASYCFYIIACFGKQTIVMLVILYEVMRVNEFAELLFGNIAEEEWGDDLEKNRISVYIGLREKPIGSTVFSVRPSKLSLLVQICSTVFGISFAFMRAIIVG